MRIYIYILLLVIIAGFTSCNKVAVDTDLLSSRISPITVTSGTSTRTPATNVAALSFEISTQLAKTVLSNKTLTMNYNEDITLLARKDSLASSWAIIFTESFTGTQLAKFNYTITGKTGIVTTNYAEPNLNNVTMRSTRDTTINSIAYSKISFNRVFVFSNTYSSSTEAAVQYDYEMNTRETINFSAFITSASGKSATATGKTSLIYY